MCKKEKKLFSLFIILNLIFIGGCATNRKKIEPVTEKIDLRYRMPAGQILQYKTTNSLTQTMDIREKDIQTTVNKAFVYTVNSKGQKENNAQLEFTIDSASMNIISPAGNTVFDLSSVVGQSFQIVLSSLGEELEYTGLDSIKYTIGPKEQSISSEFQSIFPDLAGKYILQGDSWTILDTIKVNSDEADLQIVITSENTVDGFERIMEHDCVRIKVNNIGTLTSKAMQQGMEIVTTIDIEGDEILYFDHINGIFIKMISKNNGTGIIEASGPETMTIPVKQKIEIETVLVNLETK